MNYKREYNRVRTCLLDFMEIGNNDLKNDCENLTLKDLMDIILDRYCATEVYTNLLETAYYEGLKPQHLDEFVMRTTYTINRLKEGEQLKDTALVDLVQELNIMNLFDFLKHKGKSLQ